MALVELLNTESINLVVEDQKKTIFLEVSSSGYRQKFVTISIEQPEQIDQLIEALQRAKTYL